MSRHTFRQTERKLQRVAKHLQQEFPGLGFALIVFPFEEQTWSTYVSNAQRPDMIKALREAAVRLELRMDNPPGADSRIYNDN